MITNKGKLELMEAQKQMWQAETNAVTEIYKKAVAAFSLMETIKTHSKMLPLFDTEITVCGMNKRMCCKENNGDQTKIIGFYWSNYNSLMDIGSKAGNEINDIADACDTALKEIIEKCENVDSKSVCKLLYDHLMNDVKNLQENCSKNLKLYSISYNSHDTPSFDFV